MSNWSVESSSENPNLESPGFSSFHIALSEDDVSGPIVSTPDDVGGSGCERPVGIKKSRLKRKNVEIFNSDVRELKEQNAAVLEILQKSYAYRHKALELEERTIALRQLRDENKILAINLNEIADENDRAAFQAQKEEIRRKRAAQRQPSYDQSAPDALA